MSWWRRKPKAPEPVLLSGWQAEWWGILTTGVMLRRPGVTTDEIQAIKRAQVADLLSGAGLRSLALDGDQLTTITYADGSTCDIEAPSGFIALSKHRLTPTSKDVPFAVDHALSSIFVSRRRQLELMACRLRDYGDAALDVASLCDGDPALRCAEYELRALVGLTRSISPHPIQWRQLHRRPQVVKRTYISADRLDTLDKLASELTRERLTPLRIDSLRVEDTGVTFTRTP